MPQTRAGATIPEVTHHRTTLNGRGVALRHAGTGWPPDPARSRVSGELVGVSQAHPADRRAPRHRRRTSPASATHASRAGATTRAPSRGKALPATSRSPNSERCISTARTSAGVSTFRHRCWPPELVGVTPRIETGLPVSDWRIAWPTSTHGGRCTRLFCCSRHPLRCWLTGRERDFPGRIRLPGD